MGLIKIGFMSARSIPAEVNRNNNHCNVKPVDAQEIINYT